MKTLMTAELVEKDGIRGVQLKSDLSTSPSAEDIEQLIQFLGRVRLESEPLPPSMEPPPGSQLTCQMDVRWVAQPTADDSLLLAIRHSAFGWLGIQFSAESEAALLTRLLLRQARDQTEQSGPPH